MASARILVVEDELLVAKSMQERLKRLGYDVLSVASSGEAAIQKVAQMSPHPNLVLMDIRLKGDMDGVEAAKRIRERFNIPVVYVTAYGDKKTLQRANSTGPFGYLTKPFSMIELESVVEIALSKSQMELQLINSKQWFASTLRSIGDAVIATDSNGLIKLMNPVSEQLTGWQQKEAIGRGLNAVFKIIDEDTREILQDPASKALQQGDVVGLEARTLLIAKDGTERPIDDSASPIRDDTGNICGAVVVFRDRNEHQRRREKPFRIPGRAELANQAVTRESEVHPGEGTLARSDSRLPGFDNIIGHSKALNTIFKTINQIAKTDSNVLIFGETGTGKELIARAIHRHSLRKDADFVPVDCAAIPSNLLESELFGFEKGSFTGAAGRKPGLLEFANHGTLFLDEISEMDILLQVKLLRVLQERRFRRIGGNALISVDMRVISAMNQNPKKAVADGRLRKDLFYRLNVIPLHLPPLRQRKEDIMLLVDHFIDKTIRKNHFAAKEIAADARQFLVAYHWPGNVRQLENIIERLVLLSSTSVIEVEDLPAYIKNNKSSTDEVVFGVPYNKVKRRYIEKFERSYFGRLLKYTNDNIAKAAEISGISARTIYRMIKRYGKL